MTRKATTNPKPKGSTKEALVHKFFWQRPAKHDPKKMGCPFNIYDEVYIMVHSLGGAMGMGSCFRPCSFVKRQYGNRR
jgi:hypothetical protein